MAERLFESTGDGVMLNVHAHPGAGRSAVIGKHGNALKVNVAAPPEANRANEALASLLAEEFGVKRASVSLVSGATSRSKRFLIVIDYKQASTVIDDVLAKAARAARR